MTYLLEHTPVPKVRRYASDQGDCIGQVWNQLSGAWEPSVPRDFKFAFPTTEITAEQALEIITTPTK